MGMATESQFHVLAVDDSIIDRRIIERLLKNSSYQGMQMLFSALNNGKEAASPVTTVDSGSKALQFLGLNEYDSSSPSSPSSSPNNYHDVEVNLVITDYCMPGMTGYDLLKKIKESSLLKNIPVVIMSSENVPARITRCLEEGAEEFFLKPMKLSDVSRLKPHMMKSVSRKDDQTQEAESKNREIQSQPEPQAPEEEQQQSKKRKAAEEDELSSTNRRRSRYDGLAVG